MTIYRGLNHIVVTGVDGAPLSECRYLAWLEALAMVWSAPRVDLPVFHAVGLYVMLFNPPLDRSA